MLVIMIKDLSSTHNLRITTSIVAKLYKSNQTLSLPLKLCKGLLKKLHKSVENYLSTRCMILIS